MKKIVLTFLCIFLLLGSTLTIAQPNLPKNEYINSKLIGKYVKNTNNENETTRYFATVGPRKLSITIVTVDNISSFNITMFLYSMILTIGMRLAFLPKPLLRPTIFIIQDKIDFTIQYKKDIIQGNISKNRYTTWFGELVNDSFTNETMISNQKHTASVKGFRGLIILTKRSLGFAPSFVIAGGCDSVTIIK